MSFRKIALLTIVSLPLTSVAQRPGPPMFDIDKLAIILELDAYQQTEVERIFAARRDSMRSLREAGGERPSGEEMRAAREAARSETTAELQAVLTAEQLEKFAALTELVARGRGRGRFGE